MSEHDAFERCQAACEDGTGRRAFLRDGLMALAALTALGATAARLNALTRVYATGSASGDTVRYPIPAADGATIDTANKIILVRYAGAVHAFSLECPHKKTPLEWQPGQSRFYCPKHKSTFRPEGTLIQGKATRNLDRFAVRIEDGDVLVDTATRIRSDRDAGAWADARATA
ncbi:MAG: Rieske (2Fe-2S) protein [Gemmatimonadaceae bacterium]